MGSAVDRMAVSCRCQNTIKNVVSFLGIGIHTGRIVSIRFLPAKSGTGVVFKRTDLPGEPTIPATLEYVCETSRSTSIGVADVRLYTVEHVLAAVKAYQIDNLIIEISSIEPPVGNGSSDVFVEMLDEACVQAQEATTLVVYLAQPVYWSEDDVHIVAIPYDGYRISYTLSYPESKVLKSQYQSFEITTEVFNRDLAPCRTFSEYKEVEILMDRGLIKGGSLDNAVIIKDDVVISKEGLFFPDEMVRHKILDVVGDLSLIDLDFRAHIIAIRSGHKSNFSFAQKLYKTLTSETSSCQQK